MNCIDIGDVKNKVLKDICLYVGEKISIDNVDVENYVSTENLLQNKGGLTIAEKIPSGKVTKFQRGDVLVSNIRPYFKKIWLADRDGGASNDVLVLRRLSDSVDERYLYYILADDKFFNFSMASASGSKMPRGDKAQIMNYPVILPSIEKQKKIADILGNLDEKIEINRRMNEALEQIGQTLFRHYFIDNPDVKNWKTGTIDDLGGIITGKTPSKKIDEYFGKDMPFLKVPDMHNKSVIINTNDGLTILGVEFQKNKTIAKYSTCVSCIATVGVVSLSGVDLQTNQQINSIVPRQKHYRFYNYYAMRHKSDYIKTLASSGSATPNLNRGQFAKISVVLPPDEVLKSFDERAESVFEQIIENTYQIDVLIKIRDSLLPKLISGERGD